jgi:hypothetical protein
MRGMTIAAAVCVILGIVAPPASAGTFVTGVRIHEADHGGGNTPLYPFDTSLGTATAAVADFSVSGGGFGFMLANTSPDPVSFHMTYDEGLNFGVLFSNEFHRTEALTIPGGASIPWYYSVNGGDPYPYHVKQAIDPNPPDSPFYTDQKNYVRLSR